MGSADANDVELVHRHGAGLMFRRKWGYVSASGGVTLLHDFPSATMMTGGHFAADMGLRAGPVQIGFPIILDVISLPRVGTVSGTTFSFTLGVQI